MATGVTALNRALSLIPKRAEQRQTEQLRETFSDSGVAIALQAIDHQVIYGRRGTGKTHALRYFESEVRQGGDIAIYADLRVIGSPEGLFGGEKVPPTERAARLLIDLLTHVHNALLESALSDDSLLADVKFVDNLDALLDSLSTVRVEGEVEKSTGSQVKSVETSTGNMGAEAGATPKVTLSASASHSNENQEQLNEVRKGVERSALNFTDVGRALRGISNSLQVPRIWILLDEWGTAVPHEVQPLLGEFIVRCILPLQKFTVKISTIEQQANFRSTVAGQAVGIELGADMSANVNMDEFMVYEQHEIRSYDFFRNLFFKHLTSGSPDIPVEGLNSEADLVRLGFTEKRAFEELVRAAEGVPRDAINIAGKAAMLAGSDRISVNNIRAAARTWFQNDKEAALSGLTDAKRLLNWIIDKVIREKRARGFLVNQKDVDSKLLLMLFEARVLHIVRRGYSAQDEPGERYDVWVIDYGAYVDLIHTKNEPQGLLASEEDGTIELPDVPTQDLRAIRRAILDLKAFHDQEPPLFE